MNTVLIEPEHTLYIRIYCHVCGVYATRINRGLSGFNQGVYSNPCRDYIQQISHTLSRLMAHKREYSNISVVDSALVIIGCSLLPFSPESWSSADLTSQLLNHYSLHLHLVKALPLYPSTVIPFAKFLT
jgi:hypothetical protein